MNDHDRNFTRTKMQRRRAQLEQSVARYLSQLDAIDLQEPSEELAIKTEISRRSWQNWKVNCSVWRRWNGYITNDMGLRAEQPSRPRCTTGWPRHLLPQSATVAMPFYSP